MRYLDDDIRRLLERVMRLQSAPSNPFHPQGTFQPTAQVYMEPEIYTCPDCGRDSATPDVAHSENCVFTWIWEALK